MSATKTTLPPYPRVYGRVWLDNGKNIQCGREGLSWSDFKEKVGTVKAVRFMAKSRICVTGNCDEREQLYFNSSEDISKLNKVIQSN